MKIRKISQNEVSVYISEQELDIYNIKTGDKIPQSAELHKFLFKLMDTVYNETGFDPYGGQVIVEAVSLQDGMRFKISKVSQRRRLTREEFKNIRNIRVKQKQNTNFTHNDILSMIDDIGKSKSSNRMGIFFFSKFSGLESALSAIPENALQTSSLYRSGNKYVIISDFKKNTKYYNILSEFSDNITESKVTAHDIREGWSIVVKNEDFVKMAKEIHKMQ